MAFLVFGCVITVYGILYSINTERIADFLSYLLLGTFFAYALAAVIQYFFQEKLKAE